MRLCSPRLLLALCLFSTSFLARAQPAPCQTQVRHIELKPGSMTPAEICISPNLSTTVLFDRKLAPEAVVLEGRDRFERVSVTEDLLVLVPSERLAPGERLRLEVRFAGGAPAGSAGFVLVVHRGQAERQVEVSLASPSATRCQQEVQLKEEELQQCRAQRAASSPTLVGLLATRLMNHRGVSAKALEMQGLTAASTDGLGVAGVTLYHSAKRIAVELEVENSDHVRAWVPEGAALRSRPDEVLEAISVMQVRPLAPGTSASIWVELELSQEAAPKSYSLEMWDAGRARILTLHGLKLP
jgi:uncharacterized protein (TIGR02268 family)